MHFQDFRAILATKPAKRVRPYRKLNRSARWPLARSYKEAREAALNVGLVQHATVR